MPEHSEEGLASGLDEDSTSLEMAPAVETDVSDRLPSPTSTPTVNPPKGTSTISPSIAYFEEAEEVGIDEDYKEGDPAERDAVQSEHGSLGGDRRRGRNASIPFQHEFSVMKQKLSELERRLLEQKTFEEIQESWDSAKDKYGSDKEREVWEHAREGVERKLDERKESYELSTRWIDNLREEMDRKLGDQENFEAKLMAIRNQWEQGHRRRDGIHPLYRATDNDGYDSDELEWKQIRLKSEYERLRKNFDFEQERLDFEYRRKQRTNTYHSKRYYIEPSPPPPRRRRVVVYRSRSGSRSRSRSRSRLRLESSTSDDGDRYFVKRIVFHPANRDIYAKPGETLMEWPAFNKLIHREEIRSTAIDILIGEPYVDGSVLAQGRGFPVRAQGGKLPAKQNLIPRQAPLPERMRINSTPLIDILEKIHGNDLSPKGVRPITMIRPYKSLVYYEDKLRKWYDKLVEKYQVRTDVSVEDEEAKEHDGANTDDDAAQDTESYDNAHYDAQSGQEDEENGDARNEEEEEEEEGDEKLEDEEPNEKTGSTTALEHLSSLLLFIDKINAKIKYLRSSDCKSVSFSDIWHLFKPGDFAINRDGRQAYRVISVTSTPHKESASYQTFWTRIMKGRNEEVEEREEKVCIHCVYIDFNGENIGPVTTEFRIKRFEGEKPLKSLELYPLNMPADQDIWDRLKERGKKFIDVAGVKHMYYDGYTLDALDEINGQVMVDFEEAFLVRDQENWRPQVEAFAPPATPEESEPCNGYCCSGHNVHADAYVEQNRNEEFMASLFSGRSGGLRPSVAVAPRSLAETVGDNVTAEELVIMSYRAFGFGLSSRTWAKLHLDHLDLVYDDGEAGRNLNSRQAASKEQRTAFDELVLPRGSKHKHIVKSLIAQHFKDKDKELATGESDQPDMVRGKGKGLILLLHGAPGVGKTTTAEGVAEFFKRPLFQITCGDLGTTAKDVEAVLVRHFALAGKWGCILLLDEADVFLAQRDRMDYKRNGLVAVFLRILEYYTGVLFLTTNRLGDFDEAFASRIHISLYYPDLDQDSTRKVFELNLERIRKRRGDKVDIFQGEITEFINEYWDEHPDAHWNGRQIRNACQTALALAEFEAMGNRPDPMDNSSVTAELKRSHFETVAAAYVEFMKYVDDIHGVDAAQRAWEQHLRVGRRSGRRNRGSNNALLMPKDSSLASRLGTADARNARSNQYPQHAVQQGGIPVQQQPVYQPQPQPGGVMNVPGGYGVGNTGSPGVAYSYYPPQGSSSGYTPAIHVEAPQQPQPPQGWSGNPPATGAAVPGSMQMPGGYMNAGTPPQMGPPVNANMATGSNSTMSEGGAAFYDQQQQQGQPSFPGNQGYPSGQMQMNPMNQQATNQSPQMQQLQGQQQQMGQLPTGPR